MRQSLRSLRLITDPTCSRYHPSDYDDPEELEDHGRVDLSSFRNLRSICWTGPADRDHRTLDAAIKNNAHHLDNLELDLLYWWAGRRSDIYDESHEGEDDNAGYFGNALRLHQCTPQPIFRSLTSLVLAHAPLGPAMVDMINFEILRSLTLRLCPSWTSFTQRIVKTGLPVRLKTLELHHDLDISVQTTQVQTETFASTTLPRKPAQYELEEFIDACGGLEELRLNLPKPFDAWSLWEHVSRHEASLKRLVLHHTTRYYNRSLLSGIDVDLPNLGLTEHEDRLYHPPLHHPIAKLKLECISLCCFPDLAVRETEDVSDSDTNMLHRS